MSNTKIENGQKKSQTVDTVETPVSQKVTFSPEFLNQFEFVRVLGVGGMGQVFLMKQKSLDRLVAIKILRNEAITSEEKERLVREARILASVNHANILAIHDVGYDHEMPYMVCEYVEGDTLRARLNTEPPLNLIASIRIILQVLDGLHAAHEKGVIHRDLKPENILLTKQGKPKIGDFGLARVQKFPSGASVGIIMGTPQYMSPEQCASQEVTAASDVYAVGVILFQMATGQLPFSGPNPIDFLYQHSNLTPPRAKSVVSTIPDALDDILAKSLEKDPGKRFVNAKDLMRSLFDFYRSITSQTNAVQKNDSVHKLIALANERAAHRASDKTPRVPTIKVESPAQIRTEVVRPRELYIACLLGTVLSGATPLIAPVAVPVILAAVFIGTFCGNDICRNVALAVLVTSLVGLMGLSTAVAANLVPGISAGRQAIFAVVAVVVALDAWLLSRPRVVAYCGQAK